MARQLTGWVQRHYPDLGFDRQAVAFGAAIHARLEDLLVSLADKVWKAKRVADLEQLVIARLVAASGRQPWEVFMALDDVLDRIAAGPDLRLAFQASCPIAA